MKYTILKIEPKAFEKDGETREFKSLMLEREGAQYPIKNVALWSDHPDYNKVQLGEEYNWHLDERDSKTENPHKPGTFYKNRSVSKTLPEAQNANVSGLEAKVTILHQRLVEVEKKVGLRKEDEEPSKDITPEDIPF